MKKYILLITLLILLTGCIPEETITTLEHPFMDYDESWILNAPKDYQRNRIDVNGSLGSFIFIYNKPLNIKIPIKNDCYTIQTFHGDNLYAQGPHYIEIENNLLNAKEYNQKEEYLNFTTNVCVKDEFLDILLGKDYKNQKDKFEHNTGYSMLNAIAISKNNSKTYFINFGDNINEDENKFFFILAGLEANPESCTTRFLEEQKCQGNAVMKRFQKVNCDLTWALWKPCENECEEGECVN